MKVLLVGDDAATRPMAAALQEAGTRVDHAPPESAMACLAAAPERFALVLAEHQGACADRRLLDAVTETGAVAPVLFLTAPSANAGDEPPPICAIEQTPDGPRLLRCALAQARSRPGAQSALADALGDRPHVFAYCAPARRSG